MKIKWKLLVGAMILAAICGLCSAQNSNVIVLGLPQSVGSIDGDKLQPFGFWVFNPHLVSADVEVIAPGCACTTESVKRATMFPLTVTHISMAVNPMRMPVGDKNEKVSFRGFVGGNVFKFSRDIHFTVQRDLNSISTNNKIRTKNEISKK